jgi:hypothetical protein
MKTIAQQLNIKEFPFIIKDKNSKVIYTEYSTGDYHKRERDENGNTRYYENSKGYWKKCEYDEDDNVIYSENSYGVIKDNRVKEMTILEIEKALNIKNLKIVK